MSGTKLMVTPAMKKINPCESVSTFLSTLVEVGSPSSFYTFSMLSISLTGVTIFPKILFLEMT